MHEAGIAKDLISSVQEKIKDMTDVARIKKVNIRFRVLKVRYNLAGPKGVLSSG